MRRLAVLAAAAVLLVGGSLGAASAQSRGYGTVTRNGQVVPPPISNSRPAPPPLPGRTTSRVRIPLTPVPRVFGVNGQPSILPPRRPLVTPGVTRQGGRRAPSRGRTPPRPGGRVGSGRRTGRDIRSSAGASRGLSRGFPHTMRLVR